MWILKYSLLLLFVQAFANANTSSFTSPSCFSMGGGWILSLSVNTQIKNPAVFNHSRSLTTSIVKYPALINSQSLNINLPSKKTSFFLFVKIFIIWGYSMVMTKYGEYNGAYRSYETWIDGDIARK